MNKTVERNTRQIVLMAIYGEVVRMRILREWEGDVLLL